MKKTLVLLICACLLYLVSLFGFCETEILLSAVHAESSSGDYSSTIAKKIKKTYDQNLFKLEPRVQGHFAIRMWRITADSAYLNSILFHYLVLKEQFVVWINNLYSEQFRLSFAERLLSERFKTAKGKIRRQLLEKKKGFVFASELLETAYQIHTVGMDKAQFLNQFERVRNYLINLNFKEFLLDSQMVKYYAPQVVNYVYYLKLLNIVNFETEFEAVFKAVFPSQKDFGLDEVEYENKLYGLTHFVIAGSDYYQNYVSAEKYQWILDYFDQHIEQILTRSKPDVIAEIGLCFKLCGQKNHRVVALTQRKILEAFDSKRGLIPPQKGKANLDKSEHRNIIAYLLLTDFDHLYPGPYLREIPELEYLIKGGGGNDSE